MDLKQRFFEFLKQENMIAPSDRVLVALSGGKDSVCLAYLLSLAKERFGFELAACHVHHGIRGEEADRDARFCETFCKTLSLPLFVEYCDVPAYCKEHKVGLEEGARIERYRLLRKVSEREGFQKIAVAHNASDQAETVLFRLVRGTGFSGTRGILPVRENVIRPLLPFYAEEIEEFLEKNQLLFTQDLSNFDTIYARNLIRRDVFPLLETINPRAKEALNRFGTLSRWQEAMLEKLCNKLEEDGGFSLRDGFIPLETASELAKSEGDLLLLFYALSKLTKKYNISIDFVHFRAVLSLLNHPVSGKIIEISSGFCFEIRQDRLVFGKNESNKDGIEYQIELSEGENLLPFSCGILSITRKEGATAENINKKSLIMKLDSDRIDGRLKARSLKPGDRIRMYGMHKSVKKMLCDSGIPKEFRPFIPAVCDDDEIVWIPFLGLCDKVRRDRPKAVLELTLSGETPEKILRFSENKTS